MNNIQKTNYKVSDFISWKKRGNLILSPDFQRRSVWKPGAKSFLLDTIYNNLPIPIIFLRDLGTDTETFEPKREVVDGQQRLRTIIAFIAPQLIDGYNVKNDGFVVKKTHNPFLAGKLFSELDDQTKQRILDYEFSVHVLPSNMDDREVIQIFRRMNSTNYSLNPQELRNAQFFGEFKTLVYELASEQLNIWRDWKTFSEDDIARMNEVEHTTECVISMLTGTINGKTASLIDKYYNLYDENFPEKSEIELRFRCIMDIIYTSFNTNKDSFAFFKKTLNYVFFIYMYDLIFGLTSSLNKHRSPNTLSVGQISKIKLANERIEKKTVSSAVIESTERRTTNPKERKILFDYLKSL